MAGLPHRRPECARGLTQPRDVLGVDEGPVDLAEREIVLEHHLRVRAPVNLRTREDRQSVPLFLATEFDAFRRLGIPDIHAIDVGGLVNQAKEVAFVTPVETWCVVKGLDVEILALVSRVEIVNFYTLQVVQDNGRNRNLVITIQNDLGCLFYLERQSAVAVSKLQVALVGDIAEYIDRKLAFDLFVRLEREIQEHHLTVLEFDSIFAAFINGLFLTLEHPFAAQAAARELQPSLCFLGLGLQVAHVSLQLVAGDVHAREHPVDLALARPVGIHGEDLGQDVVGHPRPCRVNAFGVG